jgi:hypothetical protein
MVVLQDPSKSRRPIGETEVVGMLCSAANVESMKQWEDPESIRVRVSRERMVVNESVMIRESGSERAVALSQTNLAMRVRSMQSSVHVAYL